MASKSLKKVLKGQQKSIWPVEEKVMAVVPAHNEEANIGKVVKHLKVCQKKGVVQAIVVVSDGSTDKTTEIARREGAKVIEFRRRKGKAKAVANGMVDCIRKGATVVLTLDADLKKITPRQVKKMAGPIISDRRIDMVIGSVKKDYILQSGQRAIRARALKPLMLGSKTWHESLFMGGYALEEALNHLLRGRIVHARTNFATVRPVNSAATIIEGLAAAVYSNERQKLAERAKRNKGRLAASGRKGRKRLLKAVEAKEKKLLEQFSAPRSRMHRPR